MKATDHFGGCAVLDVVLRQSNSGDDTGLAVTLVTLCCLLACHGLGISISKKQHRHNISEVWGCIVSRTGGIGSTYWGHWHSNSLYQSICLAQGMLHYGDAEIQEAHMS